MDEPKVHTIATFTAPVSGWYEVKSNSIRFEPNGKMKTIQNPEWSFLKFWVKKYIQIPEYEQYVDHEGKQLKYLRMGDQVKWTK